MIPRGFIIKSKRKQKNGLQIQLYYRHPYSLNIYIFKHLNLDYYDVMCDMFVNEKYYTGTANGIRVGKNSNYKKIRLKVYLQKSKYITYLHMYVSNANKWHLGV